MVSWIPSVLTPLEQGQLVLVFHDLDHVLKDVLHHVPPLPRLRVQLEEQLDQPQQRCQRESLEHHVHQ